MKNSKFISVLCILLCLCMTLLASCGYDENDNRVTTAKRTSETASTEQTSVTAASSTKSTQKTTAQNYTSRDGGEKTQTVRSALAENRYSDRYLYTRRTNPRSTIPQDVEMLGGYDGMRDVTARQIVADMRVGLCIDDYIDTTHLDESRFHSLLNSAKKSGFNAVRLLVSFENHIDDSGTIDPVYLQKVQSSVDAAVENRLYCILTDVKEEKIIKTDSRADFDKSRLVYSDLWKQIANYFKNYGDKLLFCGYDLTPDSGKLNGSAEMYNYINMLNNDFVSAVRSTGGNNEVRHLAVSTFQSSADSAAMNAFKCPKDRVSGKIIANVELFSPEGFCTIDDYKQSEWGSALEQNVLATKIAAINSALYKNKGCPVIIGKFAAADKNNSNDRAFYSSCMVMSAYNYGITCFWFDNNADYRLFDRYTSTPYYDDIISSMIVASR